MCYIVCVCQSCKSLVFINVYRAVFVSLVVSLCKSLVFIGVCNQTDKWGYLGGINPHGD